MGRNGIRLSVALLSVVLFASVGAAAPVCDDLACSSIAEDGYLLVVDGHAANPDPTDGYVLVEEDGTVCVGSKDGPYSDTTPNDGDHRDPDEACGAAIVGFGPACNDLFCYSVRKDGHLLVVDGHAGNPDPTDGYVLVEEDGTVCVGSKDGPYSDTTPNDGSVRDPDETCTV